MQTHHHFIISLVAVLLTIALIAFWCYQDEQETEAPESTVDVYYRTSTDAYPGRLTKPVEVNP